MKIVTRYLSVLFFTALVLEGCKKDNTSSIRKCYEDITGMDVLTDTSLIFPFGTKNFWIYDDSIQRQEDLNIRLLNSNFLITSRKLFLIDNKYNSIVFNQLLPPITLIHDTIFTTDFLDGGNPNCFDHHPFLFRTDSLTQLNAERSKVLYPEEGKINTKIGSLTYNYIYEESEVLKYYINPKIGIIRIELRNINGTLIRSYTLNNYYIF